MLAQQAAASEAADAAPSEELPGRELLLYLAEFDGGDGSTIDPLELESLPLNASGYPTATNARAAESTLGAAPASTREEPRDETE